MSQPSPFAERRRGNPIERLDVAIGDLLTAWRRRSFPCDGKSLTLCLICNMIRNHFKYGFDHDIMYIAFPPQKWGWSYMLHTHKEGNMICRTYHT